MQWVASSRIWFHCRALLLLLRFLVCDCKSYTLCRRERTIAAAELLHLSPS